jgi:hypothetical protein
MTVSYPRPILTTSGALPWFKLPFFVVCVILLVTYFGAASASPFTYLPSAFAMTLISALWSKCWMELRTLEREHTGEPTRTMMLLFDVCAWLPLVQLFVVFALTAVMRAR